MKLSGYNTEQYNSANAALNDGALTPILAGGFEDISELKTIIEAVVVTAEMFASADTVGCQFMHKQASYDGKLIDLMKVVY